jgi:uncharacterized membrane protein YoaK (UPF0700 family)
MNDTTTTATNRRRRALHAAVALLCLPSVLGSSRNIPTPGRPYSSTAFFLGRGKNHRSPSASLQKAKQQQQASPALRFSNVPEDDYELPPTSSSANTTVAASSLYEEETQVTTTSFFHLPSEDPVQEPLSVEEPAAVAKRQRRRRQPWTQSQIQNTFVYSLMAISGFIEGFCIKKHGCFPNLMTGTILKLAEAIGSFQWLEARFFVSMVAAYMVGGTVFGAWKGSTKHDGSKSSTLTGVSVLSTAAFLLSDVLGKHAKLPLLAAGFGILNAGTLDIGAGVTNAMTGHVTRIGKGLVANGDKSHHASAKGLVVFATAALLSNIWLSLAEKGLFVASVRLPMGTTLAVVYAALFRWYLGAFKARETAKTQ